MYLYGAHLCYSEEASFITAVKKPAQFVISEVLLWMICCGGLLNIDGECVASGGFRVAGYTIFLVLFAVGSVVNYGLNGYVK